MVQKSIELLSVLIKKIYKIITNSVFYFIYGHSSNQLLQQSVLLQWAVQVYYIWVCLTVSPKKSRPTIVLYNAVEMFNSIELLNFITPQ